MSKASAASHRPFVRSPYNYDRMAASDLSGLSCPEESLTQQHFTRECDPNFIVDRVNRGLDISLTTRRPFYGDFSEVPGSYQEALNNIIAAKEAFMELPAKVRAKFDNDPGQFLDALSDPDQADYFRSIGILQESSDSLSTQRAVEADDSSAAAAAQESSSKPSKGKKGGNTGD